MKFNTITPTMTVLELFWKFVCSSSSAAEVAPRPGQSSQLPEGLVASDIDCAKKADPRNNGTARIKIFGADNMYVVGKTTYDAEGPSGAPKRAMYISTLNLYG